MAKSNNFSILQFSGRGITRLRATPSGKGLGILACDRLKGDWDTKEALDEALAGFLRDHPVEDDLVCSVLPRHEVTVRILDLPTQDPEEVSSMVRLSAEEFVPYSVDELTIDECILESLPNGESRVLAVLVHRDVIEGHIATLRQAGVVPHRVFLSTACIASAAGAAKGREPGQFAIADLGGSGLEVLVMEAGRLRYSRGIAGTLDWSRAGMDDDVDGELGIEVRDSLGAYRRESDDGLGVDTVLVNSEWMECAHAAKVLANETEKDCAAVDFGGELAKVGGDKLDAPMLTALGAALAAMGKSDIRIELLPESVSRVRGRASLRTAIIRGGICAGVMIATLLALFLQSVQQRRTLIRDLERESAVMAPNALNVQAKLEKLQILERQVTREGTALEVLAKVSQVAPPNLNVTRLVYDRERGIEIFGRAMTRDDALTFTDRLRQFGQSAAAGSLGYFQSAQSLYEKTDYENRQEIVIYRINVPKESGNAR